MFDVSHLRTRKPMSSLLMSEGGSLPLAPPACALSATPSAGDTPATPPILSHGLETPNGVFAEVVRLFSNSEFFIPPPRLYSCFRYFSSCTANSFFSDFTDIFITCFVSFGFFVCHFWELNHDELAFATVLGV